MSFESWLAERLTRTNEGRSSADRGIFEAACPFCKTREHSFWFSLSSMRGGCLRKAKCGWRGDAVQLVMALEGCLLREAIELVRQDGGRTCYTRSPAAAQVDNKAVCKLPDEYVLFAMPGAVTGNQTGRVAWDYLCGRGVTADDVLKHRIGYCASGRYNDRVIVPVIEHGETVYFVSRLFRGKGKPYKYPTTAEAGGRGQSDVLFNLDGIRGRPRVRVVEGVWDAMAEERRGQSSVAMLGLAVSEIQAAKLALAGCQEAVVEADNDAPRREIEKIARKLEGVMSVRIAKPDHDPDEQMVSPKATVYGLAGRVVGRLRGK